MAKYVANNKLDAFFWCFNGNSGDTGGLLDPANRWHGNTATWNVVDTEKLAIVASAHSKGINEPTDLLASFQSNASM
jgi:hypothetical protein